MVKKDNMKNSNFIKTAVIVLIVVFSGTLNSEVSAQSSKKQRYKVAVCDWMILKRQKLGAFALAAEIKAESNSIWAVWGKDQHSTVN